MVLAPNTVNEIKGAKKGDRSEADLAWEGVKLGDSDGRDPFT
jgi:hypothetical protein